jgi:predicted CoA-binding protein
MPMKASMLFLKSVNLNGGVDKNTMPTLTYTDDHIAGIFQRVKTIAMVGASPKPHRASHRVMQFLQERGYRVIPVNTRKNDDIIHGEKVYSSLAEIPDDFQMVDIFRNIEGAIEITDEAIALSKNRSIETVWMQLKIQDSAAAARAEQAGLNMVMDRCPAIEIRRLIGSAHLL